VARSSARPPPIAIRLEEAKKGGAVLQRGHDLHVDHAGFAVEQVADPDLAIDVHAGGQAVAAVGGPLQREGIDRPLDHEESDGGDIDPVSAHVAPHRYPVMTISGHDDIRSCRCTG
jgi:hypothetical protein